ncbi:MAG TPA: DUF4258 domain-containing protein [Flavipsychrobacter sp.]|nr:DUF4258 domain-containing protein [Flavipsychrobacter sp.]
MKFSKLAPFLIILALGLVLFIVQKDHHRKDTAKNPPGDRSGNVSKRSKKGLDRHPAHIAYSRHAQCRMACRDITKAEIKEVLEEGTINYSKSDLQQDDCHKRYAVEDKANGQHIRIVVAACENTLTVITCIDLDKEWTCHCPGD